MLEQSRPENSNNQKSSIASDAETTLNQSLHPYPPAQDVQRRLPSAPKRGTTWHNWSKKYSCNPQGFYTPQSDAELAEIVGRSTGGVRLVGGGYSCSGVVPTNQTLISLGKMQGIFNVNLEASRATVRAGTIVRRVGEELASHALSLSNQADISQGSFGGLLSTGCHGSGPQFQALATMVKSFKLITASGEILTCSQDSHSDIFRAGLVSVGTCGVITEYEIQCLPQFRLKERIFPMRLDECLARTDELMHAHRHFGFFVFPYTKTAIVRTMDETTEPIQHKKELINEDLAMRVASDIAHYFPSLNAAVQKICMLFAPNTTRVDESYLAYEFKEMQPKTPRFNEMEYHLPRESGLACFKEILQAIRKSGCNVSYPIQFRWVNADDIWMSPFYGRDSASVAAHLYHRHDFDKFFPMIEAIHQSYAGRPHWGKYHSASAAYLKTVYPKWADFQTVRRALDPSDKFLNDHLRRALSD